MTVHRPPADCPPAPQGNQCLLSHFLATAVVWEPKRKLIAHQYCDQLTTVKTGYADQYHLSVPRAQVSTHRGRAFFEVIRWQIASFKWSQGQVYFSNDMCLFIFQLRFVCGIFFLNHLAPPSKGVWCERLLGMWIFLFFWLRVYVITSWLFYHKYRNGGFAFSPG